MPPRSAAQAHMMGMACAGKISPPGGMTKEKACEFVRGYKVPKIQHVPKKLPKVKKKAY